MARHVNRTLALLCISTRGDAAVIHPLLECAALLGAHDLQEICHEVSLLVRYLGSLTWQILHYSVSQALSPRSDPKSHLNFLVEDTPSLLLRVCKADATSVSTCCLDVEL